MDETALFERGWCAYTDAAAPAHPRMIACVAGEKTCIALDAAGGVWAWEGEGSIFVTATGRLFEYGLSGGWRRRIHRDACAARSHLAWLSRSAPVQLTSPQSTRRGAFTCGVKTLEGNAR